MKIGIDFDNTIARHDATFKEVAILESFIDPDWDGSGKSELRDHFRDHPEGTITWMKLQGLVYGKYMHCAELMPGVAAFLLKCRLRHHGVYIISHKTKFGHFDPEKTPLRREAMSWMEAKRFFDTQYFNVQRGNVIFTDTREEKAEHIAKLKCDYFIDDLPEVFAEEKFPRDTKKILYGCFNDTTVSNNITPKSCWGDITDHVLGSPTDEDINMWANILLNHPVKECKKISGRGNSQVYKVTSIDGGQYVLKMYPDRSFDGRPRMKTEFNAIRFLRTNGIVDVPDEVSKDDDLNLGLYSWVDGKLIDAPDHMDLSKAVEFVRKLYKVSNISQYPSHELATEACLSAMELVNQIETRFKRLQSVSMNNPILSEFMNQIFTPVWLDLKKDLARTWPASSREKDLDQKYRILSPSDFGFHNVLKEGGKITFIDFEYFGWDDPVKLTVDFLWHPAIDLDTEIAIEWERAMADIFADDPDFINRLNAARPLYGMRWAMIMLNEFLPGFAERRRNAMYADSYDEETSQIAQLNKARCYCERVERIGSQLSATASRERFAQRRPY